jgi:hypothetical protein
VNSDAADGEERKALIDHFLAGREGPLACERMVDILAKIANGLSQIPEPTPWRRLSGWYKATRRRMRKTYKAYLPGSFKSVDFERHRYPGITPGELAARIARFQQVLGDDTQLQLHQIHNKIFRISS